MCFFGDKKLGLSQILVNIFETGKDKTSLPGYLSHIIVLSCGREYDCCCRMSFVCFSQGPVVSSPGCGLK